VQSGDNLVTNIEIVRGPEPASHRNANWIALHNQAYFRDKTCANCHTTADGGGISDSSFCSNSACHGTVYEYAGFNAEALRKILKDQLPPPETPRPQPSLSGVPTWDSFFGPLLATKCGSCHSQRPSAGLNLTRYSSAMAGGHEGPVIIPGDSGKSVLVQAQSSQHFANLSAQELEAVKKWIDAGAPEK
jgi:hypothetical protein